MHRTPEQIALELLVLRSQNGERDSLHALLSAWHVRLTARARALCTNRDAADDVVQSTLHAIVRSIGTLDDPACFGPWAMRIIARKSADWIRSRRRQRPRELPLSDTNSAAPEGSAHANPFHLSSSRATDAPDERIARVRRALDRLPPERRAILALHYAHSISVEGIANALGLSVGTVKSRMYHARRDLKRILEGDPS